MTYEEVSEYIKGLPPFIPKKVAGGGLLFDLDSIKELLLRMGDPQDRLKCIHISGTNGKGSVASFISSVLKEAGIKTGLFTSPYLSDIREQIAVDGDIIGKESFAGVMTDVIKIAGDMEKEGLKKPSEFEMVTAAAFAEFEKKGCGICVIEVGMGGEWDATNVIKNPVLSVFTNIGLDHTAVLGETLEQIASVKSGIIKPGCDVVVIDQEKEVLEMLRKKAQKCGSDFYICKNPEETVVSGGYGCFTFKHGGITEEGRSFGEKNVSDRFFDNEERYYTAGCGGVFQTVNASLAIAALKILKRRQGGIFSEIDDDHINAGLAKVKRPARFEMLSEDPVFIADGSHNEAGIKMLEESLLELYGDKKVIFIAGVLADKDFDKMFMPLMHRMKKVYTVTPDNPRALDASELRDVFAESGIESEVCKGIEEAVKKAVREAGKDDVICAFGSLYYMGELRRMFEGDS